MKDKYNPFTEAHPVIPGMGLTVEKGSVPWERPPMTTKPEEVWDHYTEKLSGDRLRGVFNLLEQGLPIQILVETMTTMGTMKGVHTVHLGMAMKPLLHEYISNLADAAGIEYNETVADLKKMLGDKKGSSTRADQSIARQVKKLMKSSSPEEEVAEINQEPPMNMEEMETEGGGLFDEEGPEMEGTAPMEGENSVL